VDVDWQALANSSTPATEPSLAANRTVIVQGPST
jgi:hypothetical protein